VNGKALAKGLEASQQGTRTTSKDKSKAVGTRPSALLETTRKSKIAIGRKAETARNGTNVENQGIFLTGMTLAHSHTQ